MDERDEQADLAKLAEHFFAELDTSPYGLGADVSPLYTLGIPAEGKEVLGAFRLNVYSQAQIEYDNSLRRAFPSYLREQWARLNRIADAAHTLSFVVHTESVEADNNLPGALQALWEALE